MAGESSLNLDTLFDFQEWRRINGDSFSLIDYIFVKSNTEVAIAYTKLFWPDLIEHEGGYFLNDFFDESTYLQWRKELGGNIYKIERVMNHIHIEDLFQNLEKVDQSSMLFLGKKISEMWSARLSTLYPSVEFYVTCEQEDYATILSFGQIEAP